MRAQQKFQKWAASHPWAHALSFLLFVPICALLVRLPLHWDEVKNDPLDTILLGAIFGWIGTILMIIKNIVKAPISWKVVLAFTTCIPSYIIYSLLIYKNRLIEDPLLDIFALATIIGLIIIILVVVRDDQKNPTF
jgi:uncharacterized membrane protein YdjX (TVP38/TMEM64 family)